LKLPKFKKCKLGHQNKIKDEPFCVINKSRKHTSKTCRSCETLIGIDEPDNIKILDGYMYVLFDLAHFDWIKIGCTINLENRLESYNKENPEDTCSYVYTSKSLHDIFNVEKILLDRIRACVKTIKGKNEWFPVKYKELLISEIKQVEDIQANQ
jgi:hypothetical protein